MLIRFGYEILFDFPAPTPMVLLLSPHPSVAQRLMFPEPMQVEPDLPVQSFIDGFGNQSMRLLAPAGPLRLFYNAVARDSGLPDIVEPTAQQISVDELPVDVLPFLLDSRYCEVELLVATAWKLFGDAAPGWARVQAVCDWVCGHVEFGYHHARKTRTAVDVYNERVGVCRDFTHLAVTLCRALNIPARYCNGYLGDIGIPPDPAPMDFNAWFEVYLGGRWYTFDARHNMPRIGRILVSRGRDAKDTAMTTSFGNADLKKFTVWTEEVAMDQVHLLPELPEQWLLAAA
jgi:transglutaminase-like putative cysteine protease